MFERLRYVIEKAKMAVANGDHYDSKAVIRNIVDLFHSPNGRRQGTAFGDDMRMTQRKPKRSSKWNQGLSFYIADVEIVSSGYWEVIEENGRLNGVCEFGTGLSADGKLFISSKVLNRYQAAQLGYLENTAAFKGLDQAKGNFLALQGLFLRGLAEDGEFGLIKNAFCWGYKGIDGVVTRIFRVYKNFEIESEVEDINWSEAEFINFDNDFIKENLNIFMLEYGYLGIHPVDLFILDTNDKSQLLLHREVFNKDTTNVGDPNMTVGFYVENQGNTTNIAIRNGSFQLGTYSDRDEPDPSGRDITDEVEIATQPIGIDVIVAAYRVPTKTTMIKRVENVTLDTINGEFVNTISNKLLGVRANGTTNSKPFNLNFYFIPITDIDATWTQLRPGINVLERALLADITTVSLANAFKFRAYRINGNAADPGIVDENLEKRNFELRGDNVAVITTTSTQTIADFDQIVDTLDLF